MAPPTLPSYDPDVETPPSGLAVNNVGSGGGTHGDILIFHLDYFIIFIYVHTHTHTYRHTIASQLFCFYCQYCAYII